MGKNQFVPWVSLNLNVFFLGGWGEGYWIQFLGSSSIFGDAQLEPDWLILICC